MRVTHMQVVALALGLGSLGCESLVTTNHGTARVDGTWTGLVPSVRVRMSTVTFEEGCSADDVGLTRQRNITLDIVQTGGQLGGRLTEDSGSWVCDITGEIVNLHNDASRILSLKSDNCMGGCREIVCESGSRRSVCLESWSGVASVGTGFLHRIDLGFVGRWAGYDEAGVKTFSAESVGPDVVLTR